MKSILAIDIGTTSTKAALINDQGLILDSKTVKYPIYPKGSKSEQDPLEWWKATCTCCRSLLENKNSFSFSAVAISGQMQNTILVDDKEAIYPAILYSDMRAKRELENIKEKIGIEVLNKITSNIQDASSVLAKLLWIKKNHPKLYKKCRRLFIGAHDYVTWKLCGAEVTDFTTASSSGLLDFSKNSWIEDIINSLSLRIDWLPDILPSDQQAGKVHSRASKDTFIPSGTPVFHVAGDAATTTVGAGAGEPGRYYIYLGTSGWIACTYSGEPIDLSSGVYNLRHPDPDRLILIGPMLTAAGNFEWLCRNFGDLEKISIENFFSDSFKVLDKSAANSPEGSNGIIYLPYLAGERSPFRDENARGVFFGLKTTSTRQDLYRSVLEGVAFSMRMIAEVIISKTSDKAKELNIAGGGAQSSLWVQIFADILGCRVNVLDNPEEVGARGAAIIVGKALGWYNTFFPEKAFFPIRASYEPNYIVIKYYNKLFSVFKELYPSLKNSYSKLNKVMKGV
jgi:xylulokinase